MTPRVEAGDVIQTCTEENILVVPEITDSAGEHLMKYSAGFNFICLHHPPCNPSMSGAILAYEVETLDEAISAIKNRFPTHIIEKHPTRIIAPLSDYKPSWG